MQALAIATEVAPTLSDAAFIGQQQFQFSASSAVKIPNSHWLILDVVYSKITHLIHRWN
jgi:hypothetical protein